jgi:hypothetical protein
MIYEYLPDKNPRVIYFQGIPLRDLNADDVAALTEQQIAVIEKTAFYRKAKKVSKNEQPE